MGIGNMEVLQGWSRHNNGYTRSLKICWLWIRVVASLF